MLPLIPGLGADGELVHVAAAAGPPALECPHPCAAKSPEGLQSPASALLECVEPADLCADGEVLSVWVDEAGP